MFVRYTKTVQLSKMLHDVSNFHHVIRLLSRLNLGLFSLGNRILTFSPLRLFLRTDNVLGEMGLVFFFVCSDDGPGFFSLSEVYR